jgi:hypothetical protein
MDEIVAEAMRKWPNVPDVYGWLGLDRRGNWLLREERIGNAALNAFISRNYAHDARGCWFFQNGPQRVFAALHVAPFVFSLERHDGAMLAKAHTGAMAQRITGVWLADDGSLVLDTDLGAGLVHDRDLGMVLESARDGNGAPLTEDALSSLQAGAKQLVEVDFGNVKLPLQAIAAENVAAHFHFEPDPAPPALPAS